MRMSGLRISQEKSGSFVDRMALEWSALARPLIAPLIPFEKHLLSLWLYLYRHPRWIVSREARVAVFAL